MKSIPALIALIAFGLLAWTASHQASVEIARAFARP